jgi:hypothetical protein
LIPENLDSMLCRDQKDGIARHDGLYPRNEINERIQVRLKVGIARERVCSRVGGGSLTWPEKGERTVWLQPNTQYINRSMPTDSISASYTPINACLQSSPPSCQPTIVPSMTTECVEAEAVSDAALNGESSKPARGRYTDYPRANNQCRPSQRATRVALGRSTTGYARHT